LLVIWDRLGVHRARPVQTFLRRHARVHTEFLPPHAPELDPTEGAWGYLKLNPLANHAAGGAHNLALTALEHTWRVARRPSLLRSFIHASRLSLRLTQDVALPGISSSSDPGPGSGRSTGRTLLLRALRRHPGDR
jgi:hypothetical protein